MKRHLVSADDHTLDPLGYFRPRSHSNPTFSYPVSLSSGLPPLVGRLSCRHSTPPSHFMCQIDGRKGEKDRGRHPTGSQMSGSRGPVILLVGQTEGLGVHPSLTQIRPRLDPCLPSRPAVRVTDVRSWSQNGGRVSFLELLSVSLHQRKAERHLRVRVQWDLPSHGPFYPRKTLPCV